MKLLVVVASMAALLAVSSTEAEAKKRKKSSGFRASAAFTCTGCDRRDGTLQRERFAFRAVDSGRRASFSQVFFFSARLNGQ
jgi:cytochrome c553